MKKYMNRIINRIIAHCVKVDLERQKTNRDAGVIRAYDYQQNGGGQ